MKARRAARLEAGGVLVAEEEEDDEPDDTTVTPAAVLKEDLEQLVNSYESWHLALERLWEIEQDGPLSEANYSRKQWLEYQMVQNLQTQERLRGALNTATIREAVHAAQQQHDTRLEEARTLAEQFLHAIATLHDLGEDLGELFADMVDGFFAPRDQHGHQAFDVADGPLYALQLFQQFFGGDPRALDAFDLIVRTHLTVGMLKQALAECPRLKPFSQTAIDSYLQHHQTEG